MESTGEQRAAQLQNSFDLEEADLLSARRRLREKERAGDKKASFALTAVKRRLDALEPRKREALRVVFREPELVALEPVEFIAHALVVPTDDPVEQRRYDEQIERIAMAVAMAHEEAGGARVVDVHSPELARRAGLLDWPGFDVQSFRSDGERDIEVKGRARRGEVRLSENEWARAASLGDRYWLYTVFDCASSSPQLLKIQNPFRKLLESARFSAGIPAAAIFEYAEPAVLVPTPKEKPERGSVAALLAVIERFKAESTEDDQIIADLLDKALIEDPIRFGELDVSSWHEDE